MKGESWEKKGRVENERRRQRRGYLKRDNCLFSKIFTSLSFLASRSLVGNRYFWAIDTSDFLTGQ